MAVSTLGGRLGHGGQVAHLIAEEILRPVRDVAVLVDLEFVDSDLPVIALS
jgi:hypothetical protein